MEEARYWMWAKTKPESNPGVNALPPAAAYGDSWEEQAFAEDAAGALGGCVWPPRSYSCSFCRRDFRSAQALGGHMNVHRRDRARLKQSPNPAAPHEVVPQNHAFNPCTSFDAPNYSSSSSHVSSFLYNNNPNPHFSDAVPFASPPFSRVLSVSSPPPSAAAAEEKISSTIRFFSPKSDLVSLVSLNHRPSWSSFLSEKRDRDQLDSIKNEEKKKKSVDPPEKEDCVTEDLSMSLNLVVSQRRTTNTSSDEEVASCKRRRINEAEEVVPLSFLTKLSAVHDVLKLCPAGSASAADELDLELRLGDAPKVK